MRSAGNRWLWAVLTALLPGSAIAETELSFFLGAQSSPTSRVTGSDPGGVGAFSFLSGWDSAGIDGPPVFGLRGTWWTPQNPNLGFGLGVTRSGSEADRTARTANGFTRLEFSEGLNTVTANVWYRWPGALAQGALTPYVGAGAGVAIPNVTVETAGGTTSGLQVTGVAVEAVAGLKYNFNDQWAIFGEYKGGYATNDVSLDNGGSLSSDVFTNSINVGVSFSF